MFFIHFLWYVSTLCSDGYINGYVILYILIHLCSPEVLTDWFTLWTWTQYIRGFRSPNKTIYACRAAYWSHLFSSASSFWQMGAVRSSHKLSSWRVASRQKPAHNFTLSQAPQIRTLYAIVAGTACTYHRLFSRSLNYSFRLFCRVHRGWIHQFQ